jgi:hypothetical protein
LDEPISSVINKSILKRCWAVGENTVVVIDKRFVNVLGIDGYSTFVEQELTPEGILLRVKKSTI